MPVEHGSRPRPIGLPNFAPDGAGRGSGTGEPGKSLSVISLLSEWNRESPPREYYRSSPTQTLAGYMFGRVVKIENDMKLYGDRLSQDTARKVKWSYLALALPYIYPLEDENLRQQREDLRQTFIMLSNYERLHKELGERGENRAGIELSYTQVKTLQFVFVFGTEHLGQKFLCMRAILWISFAKCSSTSVPVVPHSSLSYILNGSVTCKNTCLVGTVVFPCLLAIMLLALFC